ncbi:vacuolar protein sorting/targeting protein PEP1 [Rhizina undulata]
MQVLRVWALTAGLLSTFALAKDPKISTTDFDNLPEIFFYFDDSSVILTLDGRTQVVWRSDDDGATWAKVKGPEGASWDMMAHPFDNKRAFIFGEDKEHWFTKDQGKSWHKFESPVPLSMSQAPLVFHAKKPDYILYSGRKCEPDDFFGLNCQELTYYTRDGFDSDMKLMRENTHGCLFARGTEIFDEASDYTILCIVDGKDRYPENRKLVVSENFFEGEREPRLDGYKTVEGVVGIASVQKFIVAAVKSAGTEEMALYISDDALMWDRAEFPQDHGGLKEDAYTILESTPYSIQVDVLTTRASNPFGTLFTSNSNGTYFTRNLDHTNRSPEGLVDFEQIQNIQGIVMANIVDNADEVKENPKKSKIVQSRISFDDGKFDTWQPLKGPDGKNLNLHSVTKLSNGGRVFSSAAPGLVMGVGSLGDRLDKYDECDLFVSDDAGLTWKLARKDAHKYEFGGSGSVIVAIYDEDTTNKIAYSLNHGKDWKEVDLGKDVRARLLTTTPDSTSLKFTLVATGKDKKAYIFLIDFTDVFDRACKLDKDNEKDGDFEKWYARKDEKGDPDCLMGHKQYYWRRKADAECYVDALYKDPEPEKEQCECADHDFECDFNFVKQDGECARAEGYKPRFESGECKKPEDTFMGPSGYRKIPGNDCKGGLTKDEKKELPCNDVSAAPKNGDIKSSNWDFKGNVIEYFYLELAESSSKTDETIVMRTDNDEVYISHDHGKEWEQILKDVKVVAIYPHSYIFDTVYFITPTAEVWFTVDRGENFDYIKVPSPPNRHDLQVMDFHPIKSEWLIWTGYKDCENKMTCHAVAWYTTDRGEEWHELLPFVGTCKWIRGQRQNVISDKLVFCEHLEKEDGSSNTAVQLVASDDFFKDERVHFQDIIGYATMQEFIIVASVNEDGTSLKASTSIDGKTFADALFPHNFNVPHQTAYTVLDSVTHSVFLHVTVNSRESSEYGSLLKSNSNGTSYVLSLDAVNRNKLGFVDFEKMHSLEGVAITNRVVNYEKAADGEKKQLRSMITHNDGGEWQFIKPPAKDSENKDYKCSGSIDKCSLNLHHYTERKDPRDTFASGSAVGLMMGVGNVGDSLTAYADGDTFLTTDGGFEWKEVKKGQYMWEYGDQGSIIVIVDAVTPTNILHYTTDEGETWHDFAFADKGEELRVDDISTVPSDTSRKFMLWGKKEGGGDKTRIVHLDFSGLTNVQCVSKEGDEAEDDDFYLWEPKHPFQENNCLFGHVAQYNRKIPSHNCYIGRKLTQPHKILNNCTCTRRDYECDFNYERQNDETCQLVKGLPPPDHMAVCADRDTFEYYLPTGYRRLPMTTCEGGKEWDKYESRPCPGKEDEWRKKRGGARGFGLFLAIVLPIAAAFAIGWYIWTRMLDGRFGAIRLGEEHGDSPFIKYPVIAISALFAVVVAIPTILQAIGIWVSSKFARTRRYTTRSSFARGDYSIVNNDEGELLGSDDEDEV